MTKHTPGPWHVSNVAMVYADSLFVAECYNKSGQPREKDIMEIKANATLCAAAPELLVLLKELCDVPIYLDRVINNVAEIEEVKRRARNVISKAEGLE